METSHLPVRSTGGYPQPFGRYNLLFKLAKGGMATVYLARNRGPKNFEKLLAVKVIHDMFADEQEFVRMFLDEARIAARIDHPNVATIFEMGSIDERHYLAMEYVHGQSLLHFLKKISRSERELPWAYAVRIVADVAAGLHAAHELCDASGTPLHVVHRDVSPPNIMLSYKGHVKVLDFGIALAAERLNTTRTGQIRGKVSYMSPEQVQGEPLDHRSDIFSLGIVLYEMLTMKRLFKRQNDVATAEALLNGDVVCPSAIRAGLPGVLDSIMFRALASNPEKRYPSAAGFAEELENVLVAHGEVVTAHTLGTTMSRLFAEEEQERSQAIRQALAAVSADGASAAAVFGQDTEPREKTGHGELGVRWSDKHPLALMVALVVLVFAAVGGGLAYWFAEGQKERGATSTPALRARAAQSAESEMKATPVRSAAGRQVAAKQNPVRLTVRVYPQEVDAVLELRGRRYRSTRLSKKLELRRHKELLRVRAPGYAEQTVELVLDRDRNLDIKLQKETISRGRIGRRAGRRPGRRPGRRRTTHRTRDGRARDSRTGILREPRWK